MVTHIKRPGFSMEGFFEQVHKHWKISLSIVLTGSYLLYIFWYRKSSKDPPGPSGWPVIGNFFQINPSSPHQSLLLWAKQYGDIYKLTILGKSVVVLSGFDTIYEAAVQKSEQFAGRPYLFRCMRFYQNNEHISFVDYSSRWKQMKKCVMTSMKMYGEGLQVLEKITVDILEDLVAQWTSYEGKIIDPFPDTYAAISNILSSIIFGKKMSREKLTQLSILSKETQTYLAADGPGFELEICPWLRFLPNTVCKQIDRLGKAQREWMTEEIEERRSKYDPEHPSCVLDSLWCQQRMAILDEDGRPLLTDTNITTLVEELMLAGNITTSTALYSLIGLLVTHPDIHSKLQHEIDEQLAGRSTRLSDRPHLPYTEATILETLRYISHIPVSVPHMTTRDTTLHGCDIAKGTEIWFNLWSLHHDERYWDAPWEFRPERYLDEDGRLVPVEHPARKRLMAFGSGRRVCVGEALARNRLFLFVTVMLQQFDLLPADGARLPETDPRDYKNALILRPDNYRIKIIPRFQ